MDLPFNYKEIKCINCEKTYIKPVDTYIKGEQNCFDCFISQVSKDQQINNFSTLFKNIDSNEKAYILGKLYKPVSDNWADEVPDELEEYKNKNKEEEIQCLNVFFSGYEIESINLIKKILLCSNVFLKKKNHDNYHILIPQIYVDTLLSQINFDKIDTFLNNDMFLLMFLRGVIEQNSEISSGTLTVKIKSLAMLKLIGDHLSNNYILNKDSIVFNENINVLDFLGKLYEKNLYLANGVYYRQYNVIVHYYNSVKNLFLSCKIYKKDNNAVIPFKTNLTDVGYDLTVIKKVKDLTSNTVLYDTGIIVSPPSGFYIEVHPRSSLSKTGYILANSTGIIDPGYRNTLMIALTKINNDCPDLELPFRCCQMVIKRHELMFLQEVYDINSVTSRGIGGFGSTGK